MWFYFEMKIAIATCNKVPALTENEQLILPLLSEREMMTIACVWDDESINWSEYDLVIIRSIWDYHLNFERFQVWLNHLENLNISVLNNVEVLRENSHKFYLQRLMDEDCSVIPTQFISAGTSLESIEPKWDKAVIKPAISASSYRTELFEFSQWNHIVEKFSKWTKSTDFLIQKFIPEIQSFGELSIIFFNRKYSHTIIKRAKANEFRVQSEYGGKSELYHPSYSVIESASNVLSKFNGPILYARIDGTIINDQFVLMEAELVEPELFMHLAPGSREQFVNSISDLSKS